MTPVLSGKAIRLELEFTQEDLARKLNVSLSAVSKWEQGVSSPSRFAREKIEKVLKKEGWLERTISPNVHLI